MIEKRKDNIPLKTERVSLHLPKDTIDTLRRLAAKNGTNLSKEIRHAIDGYLDIEVSAENIGLINGVIKEELSLQIKKLGNRLAGLINRLTIISAAGYYANIAIISDLIDRDRYSTFEKIEAAARKKALAYANQKNADAIAAFLDDKEMKKTIRAVKGDSFER
ncbi:ribbon-helix-helix protein, CopG family [Fumia xinanensis]|uniref:CopG family transcriptional regulator n=1 Tax=Fumia xinanensis TaxID=2763659 RepID=A0A926E485_9FIRM|nr:CopG family transcriptional regulator [Fumia xinanensis]